MAVIKPAFKPKQAVTVAGTKANPERRKGKFVAEHPASRGSFLEILLDGALNSSKFRPSQVTAA